MRYLSTVPSHVLDAVGRCVSSPDSSPEQVDLAKKLVTDERMRDCWRKLGQGYNATGGFCLRTEIWGDYYFWAVIGRYAQATTPGPWDMMTAKDQDRWLARLDSLVDEVEAHLRSAPLPPDRLSFLFEMDGFAEEFPEISQGQTPGNLARRLWAIKWGLVDAMRRVASTQRECAVYSDMTLKRPRHEKNARERFIALLTSDLISFYDQPMQELVAITTEVAFSDPSVTVRLVRRVTTGR